MLYSVYSTKHEDMALVSKGSITTIKFYPEQQVRNICILDTTVTTPSVFANSFDQVLYISPQTPVAKAILDRKEGERISFVAPSGTKEIEIIKITT